MPAPVIARDPTGVLHSIVLGIRTDDGVKTGHVVLSDQGSMATGIVRGQFGDSLIIRAIITPAVDLRRLEHVLVVKANWPPLPPLDLFE